MLARDVIIAPLITEKSMTGTMSQQYTFEVHPHATKTQIRKAVEEIFGVTVRKVNTIAVGGKHKSFARRGVRTEGRTSNWKKAIITIASGQKIELGGVNYFEQ
ncbi:MAG: 50S ribosomal protein L23 [Vulcanimicrobiaceae bacterium]|jgi:large subunit ribosomal protein L23